MSDKQQTAVEWLVEQFENHRATFFKLNEKEERIITLAGKDVVQQAKEMEKKQIIEAFKHGELPPLFVSFDAEQYYNETYRGNK
jgi:hypothetical protein